METWDIGIGHLTENTGVRPPLHRFDGIEPFFEASGNPAFQLGGIPEAPIGQLVVLLDSCQESLRAFLLAALFIQNHPVFAVSLIEFAARVRGQIGS
jgi:hypothetical protein